MASTINTHGNSSQVIAYFLWANHSFVVIKWLLFNAVFFQLNLNSLFPFDSVVCTILRQYKFSTASSFYQLGRSFKGFIQFSFSFSNKMDYKNSSVYSIMCN